jgi:hypothetical protein
MGLNDMNGRIEDSRTGRFLSPDMVVTDLGDTQSFNRYSYVRNNPLTYTDPSGWVALIYRPDSNANPVNIPPGNEVTITAGSGLRNNEVSGASDSLGGGLGGGPGGGSEDEQTVTVNGKKPGTPATSKSNTNNLPIVTVSTSRPQSNETAVCKAVKIAIGGLSGAAGGAVTGGVVAGPGGAGIGATIGFALGIAGALTPDGGFGGGIAGAIVSLAAHTASGTSLTGFATVATDTAAGAAGDDNLAAVVGIQGGGTAAAEAFRAAAGDAAAASAEGGVAGGAGAVTAALTNGLLSRIAKAAGCP